MCCSRIVGGCAGRGPSTGGAEVSTAGDAFFVAFASASAAVDACQAAHTALVADDWPHSEPLRVRMGVHTGEPRVRQGDYWGRDVHYAARVASAARGGQVLGDERLITVIGTGGTGKTRVALAVADQLVDRLSDGAFLVELADVSSPDGVPGAIAGVFGVGGDATSQAPMRVAGERVYSLAPLDVPSEDTLDSIDVAPAAMLLISRAQRAGRAFAVDEDNAAAVAELCRELDGSPLAIELAAARLSLLDPAELLGRLRRSPDALGRGGRDLPHRQRGLRSAMSWSYRLLDDDTARLFRRLGHFAGEATLERTGFSWMSSCRWPLNGRSSAGRCWVARSQRSPRT
jgi:hypothetical protein